MARRPGGLVGSALTRVEEATGQTMVPKERLDFLEESYIDYRTQTRELEDIGWSVLDYFNGQPQELRQESRKRIIQRARYVWMNDPQAGAAVELMNDFCFGRGVPAPRCKDKQVQDVVDEAWNDPDNQEVLTSLEAQLALGTDLALQSNVFLLMFDDGDDGKVKLSILRHDDVMDAIPDPDMRHRLLWYVARRPQQQSYDFENGQWNLMQNTDPLTLKPIYYAHWRNVDLAKEAGDSRDQPVPVPPDVMIGDGRVYHARINRYSEMKFGAPRFQRTLRWFTAYNDFVKARIDVAQASAAYIMKRKVKAGPSQLARDAAKMVSRSSMLAAGSTPDGIPQPAPKPGSILEENESVSHEALNLGSNSAQAQQDANIIRAPISASERWSQAYFGDATNSSLATATSLELPILKAVESRQEVFEAIFRWFIDRVIERAVDTNKISSTRDPEELPEMILNPDVVQQALQEAVKGENALWRSVIDVARVDGTKLDEVGGEAWIVVSRDPLNRTHYRIVEVADVEEAHEDQGADEDMTLRDLSYEFSMPSPLRRMMSDLVSSITQIAQVFDPNNTNVELSRALLTIALGEALEVSDPADLVDVILPKGYQDPLIKAQLDQAATPPPMPQGDPGQFPSGPDGNAYGAPMNAQQPESAYPGMQQGSVEESYFTIRGRHGQPITLKQTRRLEEVRATETVRTATRGARVREEETFDTDVTATVLDALDDERVLGNGNGNGRGE